MQGPKAVASIGSKTRCVTPVARIHTVANGIPQLPAPAVDKLDVVLLGILRPRRGSAWRAIVERRRRQ